MEVIVTERPEETAGKILTDALRTNAEKPILLLVSGGSSLALLDFVEVTVLGPHITLTVLDERFSTDPKVNNFTQLEQTTFYQSCVRKGVQFVSTKVLAGESMEEVRDRFDTALHVWKEQNSEGVVMATMGIGSDGHMAGIFPGDHGVNFSEDSWVAGYTVPSEVNQYADRITVTYTFLRQMVDFAIVFAVGEEKKVIIKQLQNSNCPLGKIPACILREIRSVTVVTD